MVQAFSIDLPAFRESSPDRILAQIEPTSWLLWGTPTKNVSALIVHYCLDKVIKWFTGLTFFTRKKDKNGHTCILPFLKKDMHSAHRDNNQVGHMVVQ
jgi:hypothetical protein